MTYPLPGGYPRGLDMKHQRHIWVLYCIPKGLAPSLQSIPTWRVRGVQGEFRRNLPSPYPTHFPHSHRLHTMTLQASDGIQKSCHVAKQVPRSPQYSQDRLQCRRPDPSNILPSATQIPENLGDMCLHTVPPQVSDPLPTPRHGTPHIGGASG